MNRPLTYRDQGYSLQVQDQGHSGEYPPPDQGKEEISIWGRLAGAARLGDNHSQ